MHGMLSAAMILAAFAVITLVSGASAVWLFRAAATAPRRSRPAPVTGMPGAAGPAPDAPGAADAETGWPEADYPERSWPGAVLVPPGQPGGAWAHDRPGDPADLDDPAGPPAVGLVYEVHDVYDVEDWTGAEDSRSGYGGPGRSAAGSRAWPDTAKSLYSRGWPVMDSSPDATDPQQAGDETEAAAPGEPGAGLDAEPGPTEPGRPEDRAEDRAETRTPGRLEGARLYVLDESPRPGR